MLFRYENVLFIAVQRTHERKTWWGFYEQISIPATPLISHARWSKIISVWISKLKYLNFQIISFLYILYLNYLLHHAFYNHNMCQKLLFTLPVDKPWFAYIPYPVIPNVILTGGVKSWCQLCTRLTLGRTTFTFKVLS